MAIRPTTTSRNPPIGPYQAADLVTLVEGCAAGDEAAWCEIVSRHARLVYSIPHTLGLPPDQCDDVFQEVMTALHRQLTEIRDPQALPKWLIRIAHRSACAAVRRTNRLRSHEAAGARDPFALADDDAARWERQHMIRTALRTLGGRCEELLTLMFLDRSCTTYDEVAAALDMPIGSIGPTRARCIDKLRCIIDASERGETP